MEGKHIRWKIKTMKRVMKSSLTARVSPIRTLFVGWKIRMLRAP